MTASDTMLNCLVDSSECLYRVRRGMGQSSRIVYVCIEDPTIVPEDERTYGPSLLKHLKKLPEWNQIWTTLTIYKDDGNIRCRTNEFPPPALPRPRCPGDYPLYQITQLPTLQSFRQRVSQVQLGSMTCILKIATFSHEIPWLAQEVKAYHVLAMLGSNLVPRLLGYACEQDRIVGFLCETIVGRVPTIDDIEACRRALRQLHSQGIVHGDITKYNIVMTAEGPKFIDLEEAIISSSESDKAPGFAELKDKEIESLEAVLCDESGRGRPWTINVM
ncbi:hypothetical protein DM02DRAFT_615653 [Periconia macrospinosa]|uniref:non-specific serine/threonine protein kinase n=1 Tax=Periconia macrospinosa TaxID=97972 RepID=A0A2V1DKB6_9PLEO|nr:hypothetical protein DM02DRAFT_615653 [Periconia macrospinosa]